MYTSLTGRSLIESFETLRLVAYLPTTKDKWTLDFGHTRGVKEGDTCAPSQADASLELDLADAEDTVNGAVRVPLNQNQFDSFVSLTFNVGDEAFKISTLLKLLNAGETSQAASQFLAWDEQAGEVMPGLLRRRKAEQALFLTEVPHG